MEPLENSRQDLDLDSIHLWCTFFSEIRDAALLREYARLLSEAEQQRRSRFVYTRDQQRYLVTRALVRTVLSRYTEIAPADLTFATNAYGRPHIANQHPHAMDISFSISHTSSLIVLGIAHRRALGVDTENACTRQAPVEIAEQFFAPHEVAALYALPREHQQRRFFEYWTLKESYVKARAMGLSLPLDTFSFQFVGDRRIAISIDTDERDSPSQWLLWQFSLASEYLIAVCAERSRSDVPRLLLKEIVPLVREGTLAAQQLRMSA
jgi:4'-phosphopantetheinyl transferase